MLAMTIRHLTESGEVITIIGSCKTQAEHGIAIQDTSAGVVILGVQFQATVPTKPKTIKPQKIVIKRCNAKAKVESKLAVTHNKPDYNVDKSTFRISLGSYMHVENKIVLISHRLWLHTLAGFQ